MAGGCLFTRRKSRPFYLLQWTAICESWGHYVLARIACIRGSRSLRRMYALSRSEGILYPCFVLEKVQIELDRLLCSLKEDVGIGSM